MKTKVLRLYKDLLRYGQGLQYTDKSYFRQRIRRGFKENKYLEDTNEIEFCIERGQKALETRKIV